MDRVIPHTPGPWQLMWLACDNSYYIVERSDPLHVIAGPLQHDTEEDCANGLLLAGAAQMLAALKAVIDSDMAMREEDEGRVSDVLEMVRNAITDCETGVGDA